MSVSTLLPAHEGRRGPFHRWITHDLGLEEFIKAFPLPKLVEWRWLQPQSRILFSKDFFVDWIYYPNRPYCASEVFRDEDILWDSGYRIDSVDDVNWCVDPIMLKCDPHGAVVWKNSKNLLSIPESFMHPRGMEVFPYCEYYFHWQGYALIDTIIFSENGVVYRTPDVSRRLNDLASALENDCFDPADISYSNVRWGGLWAEHFTWLSHYRTLSRALDDFEVMNPSQNMKEVRKKAAVDLAKYLSVTASSLEDALQKSLLVVAQNWSKKRNSSTVEIGKAWKELQKDTIHCVEWLCYLGGKDLDYFLEKYQYEYLGQLEWAELNMVLDFGYFKDRKFFVKFFPWYVGVAFPRLCESDFSQEYLMFKQIREIQSICSPFGDFLASFKSMHDELNHQGSDRCLDLRSRHPVDRFANLAIRAETCLRFVLYEAGLRKISEKEEEKIASLRGYIKEICRQTKRRNAAIGKYEDGSTKILVYMNKDRDGKVSSIRGVDYPGLSEVDAIIVRAMLGCEAARNYFAHHYDQDCKMIQSPDGQFIMASVLYTTWMLLRDYFFAKKAAGQIAD